MLDIVVPLRRSAFRLGDAVDREFFRRHPERRHHIRNLDKAETRQACCLHGEAPPRRNYMVAVRLVAPGLYERRFLLNGTGDGSEACCQTAFASALIAGEPPRTGLDPEDSAA